MIRTKWAWPSIGVLILLIAGGTYLWKSDRGTQVEGLYFGNGRVEGTEIKIATKYAGRIVEIGPEEGDHVEKNDIVVRLDDRETRALVAEAKAEEERISHLVHSAKADIERFKSDVEFAEDKLARTRQLFEHGNASQQQMDRDRSAFNQAKASFEAGLASLMQAEAELAAARARIERYKAILSEMVLRAPASGRVQLRIAEPGEIVGEGGNILLLVKLDRPHMTIYLSERAAGKINVGDEALIWADAYPNMPFEAEVTFISSEAEFTPKEVQTREERENLVYRVKVTALSNSEELLKPGMPGVGLIRTKATIPWPPSPPL